MKLCECGCEKEVNNRFIFNHHRKGKHLSEDTRKQMSESHIGKLLSEDTRKQMSESHIGKLLSKETRDKMSISQTGKNNPMYGKHFSEEHKIKIGKACFGSHRSEETKKKMSMSKIGNKNPMYGMIGSKNPMYGRTGNKCPAFGRTPLISSSYGIKSICNKGHWVRSSWERLVADFLFANEIDYEFEPKRFYFIDTTYLPDFYIPSIDLWIETKGWMDPESALQIKLFLESGHNLLIIDDIDNLDETLSFLL